MQTVPMAMHSLVAASLSRSSLPDLIERRFSFPGRPDSPVAFNRLAQVDFALISEADPDAEWDDYCPAYALAFLTYESCCHSSLPLDNVDLEAQWEELRGDSRLRWQQVCAVISRSWNALKLLQRQGQL